MARRGTGLRTGGVLMALLCATPSSAQTTAASPEGGDSGAAAVGRAVDELRSQLSALRAIVDRQSVEIAELRRQLAGAPPGPPPVPPATEGEAATPPAPSLAGRQADSPRRQTGELPGDVVAAAEFPGSFKIPGSDAALKIGGLVRVNWVSTNDALVGVQDRFVTSAIPVGDETAGGEGGRVDVIASPSRFNFDLRTPTGVGHMRAFIEGDFAGTGGAFRLRHAYGQWKRVIFGQTWSTFSDPEAEPDGIDFEGLNAIVLFRQPQVRWSVPLGARTRLALALEDPRPDLTGATGVSQVPDVIARVRVEPARGGHLQVAGIGRQLRGEPVGGPGEIVSGAGYGLTVSGRLPSPVGPARDAVLFQANGGVGIGRYITDLATLGGQDAVYDPVAGTLRPLEAFSGYVGYEHAWTTQVRSSVSFGVVDVDNLDVQPGDAISLTRRYSGNVIWSPIPRVDLVAEFLAGSRTNKDRSKGTSVQTQIGATFRF